MSFKLWCSTSSDLFRILFELSMFICHLTSGVVVKVIDKMDRESKYFVKMLWNLNFHLIIFVVFLQIMVPLNYTEFIDTLTSLVKNNFIPMTRIDDAVRRILRVKFTLGLFENPLADYKLVKHVGSQVSLENRTKETQSDAWNISCFP